MPSPKVEEEERVQDAMEALQVRNDSEGATKGVKKEEAASLTSPDESKTSRSPSLSADDTKARSDSASTPDGTRPPKLSRKASQKLTPRPAPLFDHLPDSTEEACSAFQLIPDCLYGSKSLGSTEHDALDCDCAEEWRDGTNHACGDDSDCINRATKMECVDQECNCGEGCQNQRFQRKQYANVAVIKTEKKGYGLRAEKDLQANDFIFEYIGEVINEPTFRRRMIQYDKEGIKHFYFMSLTKSEFVDATKKGNLGRFCNHSCSPNSYVDKWVVGTKLRMGIFAGRKIKAGEELVFNYNVDRYGADPQPCYCGEPNCIGFIGGKTQTERATKLSDDTIEALGIDDGDGWDTTVAKKPRKKRVNEDDEEYVNSVQARGLDEQGVTKVMATLMQCKEKWIAVKLLQRIRNCHDERVLHRVVRMHGYQILKTALNSFIDDHNVVLQILEILESFPRVTKNKISDSNIESTIEALRNSEHEDVAAEAKKLLEAWSKLEVGYRIPRKKFDPKTQPTTSFDDRRGVDRAEEPATKVPSPLPDSIPKGPRSNVPQRNNAFFNPQHRQRKHIGNSSLPSGWFAAKDERGNTYYYSSTDKPQWIKPTAPATQPGTAQPKGPSKAIQDQKNIQDIIDSLTKPGADARRSASQTPNQASTPVRDPKQEKWRALPIEKQKKIYENTLFPSVKYVVDKFRHKLPKEELKKFAKDVSKKLVESDYKHNRVEDPTSITEKHQKTVKKYVKEFFDRAVVKHREYEKKRAERKAKHANEPGEASVLEVEVDAEPEAAGKDVVMSDHEDGQSPTSSPDRKRKREDDNEESPSLTPSETPSIKRIKDDSEAPSPPPPPPPPPADEGVAPVDAVVSEQARIMREQEEALERENEEAQRMEDEANYQRMLEQAADVSKEKLEAVMVNGIATSSNGHIGVDSFNAVNGDDAEGESTPTYNGDVAKAEVASH